LPHTYIFYTDLVNFFNELRNLLFYKLNFVICLLRRRRVGGHVLSWKLHTNYLSQTLRSVSVTLQSSLHSAQTRRRDRLVTR